MLPWPRPLPRRPTVARWRTDFGPALRSWSKVIRSVSPELRRKIAGDRPRFVGRGHAPGVVHVGNDHVPIARLPLHGGDALQAVTDRAAGLDQFLARASRQRDRTRRRRAGAEIGDE